MRKSSLDLMARQAVVRLSFLLRAEILGALALGRAIWGALEMTPDETPDAMRDDMIPENRLIRMDAASGRRSNP